MIFDDNFFQKEVRCDFEVPKMMKRTWAVELDLLQIVMDICDRHGIQYYADFGTLLGAVRHQGFIPWDDDVDIAVKRQDYNKLIQILPEELPDGIVMAGIHSREEQYHNVSTPQLMVTADRRLWNITDYMKRFYGYPFNYITIDIFPLDNVPMDPEIYELQKKIIGMGLSIIDHWDELEKEGNRNYYINKFETYTGRTILDDNPKQHILKCIDELAAIGVDEPCEYLDSYMWRQNRPYKKDWYEKVEWMPFENLKVPVPCGYSEILTVMYGDYRKPVRGLYAAHNYPFYKEMQREMEAELIKANVPYSLDDFCDKVISDEISIDWV